MGLNRALLLTAAAAIALVFLLSFCEAQAEPRTPSGDMFLCGDDKLRDQVKTLMLEALNEALRNHIENAFAVWMKDDREQPGRAARGVNQGVAAYLRSRRQIEQWTLPSC